MVNSHSAQPPVKDEDAAHPVASDWRPALTAIVKSFVDKDYGLVRNIPDVVQPPLAVQNQVKDYITDYGQTLAELPDESWSTSIAQWMGTHWDVLVDLWTIESGRSDLVLFVRVLEGDGPGFRIEIHSVHVP